MSTSNKTKQELLEEATSGSGRIDRRSILKVLKQYDLLHTVASLRADIAEAFFWYLNDFKQHPKPCKYCGSDLKFNGFRHQYSATDFCSVKCAAPHNVEKSKATLKERYGVTHQMHLKDTKDKIRKTCQEKYGHRSYLGSHIQKEATKEVIREKHGVDYVSQIKDVKEKKKNTFIERYGAENTDFKSEVNEKSRITLTKKLGLTWPNDHSFQQLAAWASAKSKTGQRMEQEGYTDMIFNFNSLTISAVHECGELSNFKIGDSTRCYTCHPKSMSTFEYELSNFLESQKVDFLTNDREQIAPLELDFFIPSKRIAIECNGDYWHSFSAIETTDEKNKHLRKTELCDSRGIRLIHIPEYLWFSRRHQIEAILLSALGLNAKVGARTTIVKEISSREAIKFLNENHVHGSARATNYFGLFLKDELVQVLTASPHRFKKCEEWEVVRCASKRGLTVVGGVTKLLKFCSGLIAKNLFIYVDRQLFNGSSMKHSNISALEPTKPGYRWIFKGRILSRHQCQKQKLVKILGENFDQTASESANMFNAGGRRLWDCGNFSFVYKTTGGIFRFPSSIPFGTPCAFLVHDNFMN